MNSREGWERYGFFLEGEKRWRGFGAKPGSHDDGDHHGPFLGGIGTGSFSRDIYGRFSRWNLQPGFHLQEVVPQAQLLCRYSAEFGAGRAAPVERTERSEHAGRVERTGARQAGPPQAATRQAGPRQTGHRQAATRFIGAGAAPSWEGYTPSFGGFPETARDYAALFPRVRERYSDPSFPLELTLDYWSPLVFRDYEASSLPVVFFSIHVINRAEEVLRSDFALFWPNLLGWRAPVRTVTDLGGRAWPGHGHSGNINRPFAEALESSAGGDVHGGGLRGAGVLQGRHPHCAVTRDMEGEAAIAVLGPQEGRYSIQASMKADQNALGIPAEAQRGTQGWAQEHFAGHGELPGSEETWTAHWHEPLSSAVHGGVHLAPGQQAQLHFSIVWDTPLVVFGDGRRWEKRYTSGFGADGHNAEHITRHAVDRRQSWWEEVEEQTRSFLSAAETVPADRGGAEQNDESAAKVSAAVLNELFFLTGGGSVWTAGEHGAADPGGEGSGADTPLLGGGEHFALLEGYDTGYFYYNTLDLWVYAFPALTRTWPRLADLVFEDYLKSATVADATPRIVYREMEEKETLRADALPHDIGNPMEDPWHRLNGYTMRDDPNVWKDRSPSFIIGTYLHRKMSGGEIDEREYGILMRIGRAILESGYLSEGLPVHAEFGDNTWDALQLRGYSSYSGGLSIAAYAVLSALAQRYGDEAAAEEYADYLRKGRELLERRLWNGKFYRTDSEGRYSDCAMTGALMGPFYASLAGVGALLPIEHILSHLGSVYEYNFLGYRDGAFGPLLVNDAASSRFVPDGGEELQINEVIVGSAWLYCGMLKHFGLRREAGQVSASLQSLQYERAGLQFRSPAAWDGEGRFRAPLNMRPLAAWSLLGAESFGW